MSAAVEVVNGFVQLVTHILAHVRLDQPGNLHDPRYVAWAASKHSPVCRSILARDAGLLAQLWALDPRVDRLHGFCRLHDSLAGFRRTSARELEQVHLVEVACPAVLLQLRGFVAAELVHACAALLDDEVESMVGGVASELDDACERVAAAAGPLRAVIPSFAEQTIELVWALGVHGRALDGRVLVGAPASWNGCSAERQAILAAHEHLVGCNAEPGAGYVEVEWAALCGLADHVAAFDDGAPLRRAHAHWLAELDLRELIRELVERGWIDELTAERLERRPDQRARTLIMRARD